MVLFGGYINLKVVDKINWIKLAGSGTLRWSGLPNALLHFSWICMRSIEVLYILTVLFSITSLLLLCARGPTSNLAEVGDYLDFEDPLIVSLIKATSYPVHLPLHLELLRYLALSDSAKIVKVHEEIVSWYRSPLDQIVPFSSYSGCTCGRIDESCRCLIQLIRSPIPPSTSLDPKVYHPLIRFNSCYANFNFDITFIPTQRIATVSGFISGSMKKPAPGMWDKKIAVFQGVSINTEGVHSLCAADQSLIENRPQISLCLTTFGIQQTHLGTLSIFSWCVNGTILVNNRLIVALYPMGCFEIY